MNVNFIVNPVTLSSVAGFSLLHRLESRDISLVAMTRKDKTGPYTKDTNQRFNAMHSSDIPTIPVPLSPAGLPNVASEKQRASKSTAFNIAGGAVLLSLALGAARMDMQLIRDLGAGLAICAALGLFVLWVRR